jgi:putative transposase
MSSKNRIKQYIAGGYYHIYNRGVEKRLVFMDEQDYGVFLGYLKLYLLPPEPFSKPHKDLSGEVDLAAFCLMPNHYHLLVRQISSRGIESLMRCLITSYVHYFNRRHTRVGALFQDTYKAVRVRSDEQLYQVEQYIHLNPTPLAAVVERYPYSSLRWRGKPPAWLKPPVYQGHSLYQGPTLPQGATL